MREVVNLFGVKVDQEKMDHRNPALYYPSDTDPTLMQFSESIPFVTANDLLMTMEESRHPSANIQHQTTVTDDALLLDDFDLYQLVDTDTEDDEE